MHTVDSDRIAEQLVFIHVDITCWSGKKTVTPEDLGLNRQQLPPETLVSLGDKQLIDPAALRDFTTIRSAARRHCLAVGTRFLGGYAVPVAKAGEVLARLDALGQQYQAARAAFLAQFDRQVAAWAAQQPPEWQALIRETLLDAEAVGGKLRFAVQAMRFRAPDPAVVDHPGLGEAVTGLRGQVFREISLLARDTLDRSFQGKTEVTRRALGPFQAIRDKLDGLSFVDGRFQAVVADIDQRLAGIPSRQPITGPVLESLRQFLCLASQPDGLRTWADQIVADAPRLAGLNVSIDFTPVAPADHPATRAGVASDGDEAGLAAEAASVVDVAGAVVVSTDVETEVEWAVDADLDLTTRAEFAVAGDTAATAPVADEDDLEPALAAADDGDWFF